MSNIEVCTVKEIAKYLNCSQSTIRALVRSKSIPFFRLGKKLNFNRIAIDNWIKDKEYINMDKKISEIKIKNI